MSIINKIVYQNIDLSELNNLVGGDIIKFQKYLNQFVTIVSANIQKFEELTISEDRAQIKKIVHQIKPQLIFFGVPDIKLWITRLETEIMSWHADELAAFMQSFTQLLVASVDEVISLLKASQP